MNGDRDEYRNGMVEGGNSTAAVPEEAQPLTGASSGSGGVPFVVARINPEAVRRASGANRMVIADSAAVKADRTFLYIAACVGNLASFICGTTFGWTSPEIPKLKIPGESPLDEPLTASEEGWVGSFLPLAAAVGPFAGGFMVDRIGRKKTLLVATVPFIAAFFINIAPSSVTYLYLSRFLCGLGVGSIFTVIPMYVGEIADDETRGPLGSFMQLFIVIGLLFSYALGPYLSIKLFNIILLAPPIAFMVVFFLFIPESPYYLIKAKNEGGAEDALAKLRGKSKDAVRKEIETIKALVADAEANKATFFDIFKSKGLTMALFLSVSLVACQQLSGINIILFYAQDIFTDAGVSLAPEICTIIIGIVQIAASGATPIMEKRFGKRFLLMLSGIGMGLSQGVLAYFFHLKDGGKDVSNIGWIPIACLVVYIVTYCLGFGPLPWAVMGELFPGNIKSAASTVTASGCWVLGFLLTKYFGMVANMIGKDGSFGFFAGCCFVAAAFTYKLVPETSGKSFQEIQEILNGEKPTQKKGDVKE
ncbi:unnamed protein product [Acanthoscelides obtectus]|nr:unnamed protein product [Acanthoscelides obtectus]CAK1648494.1 Facilitated trehalose transporter Tret1 [Acanthoscelides obtectus]